VFSHGNGSSSNAYGPLADFWAAHGFVVIQPTHLDSRRLGLTPDDPRARRFWRFRIEDMKRTLDQLDLIEAAVPGFGGRLDPSRIAVAGHSYGGHTASMLLGARALDASGVMGEDMSDARIKAGVLLSAGGGDLSPFASEKYPFLNRDFAGMAAPTLVIAGDQDASQLTTRGPDWFSDPYHLSSGSKCLLTLFGAEHSLGGIPGYESRETTDEDPHRLSAVQRLSWAYLRSALYPGDKSWTAAVMDMETMDAPPGRMECK
jgi:predicted dienelactone hydrolase